jgi:hypothetical protein
VAIALYMDEHVPRAITNGLRLREVNVITAWEDDRGGADDSALLERATELGRVLFTQDDDLLAEAARRQREGSLFSGLVYAHQLRVSIGRCIDDLELIATVGEPQDITNTVVFLPLT